MDRVIRGEKYFIKVKTRVTNQVQMILLLAGAAVTSALVYWIAFVQVVPLERWINIARLDRFFLYRGKVDMLWHFVLAFFSLGVLYFLAYQFASHLRGKTAWLLVIGGSVVSGTILLLMYPFDSSDIFDNIIHARMVAEAGLNPFTVPGTALRGDVFFKYMGWPNSPAAYGPLWEVVAGGAIKIGGESRWGSLMAMKVVPAIFMLAAVGVCGAILHKLDPEKAPARTLLLAWNPLVLYETWGNGHNDMAMIFWVVAAAWAIQRKHFSLGILALIMGGLFKYLPVLLIPAVGLIALNQIPKRGWLKFIVLTGAAGAALIAVSYAPFWEGLETLSISRRAGLYSSTLPAAIYHILLPEVGKTAAGTWVSTTALALTLIAALWTAFKVRKQDSLEGFISASFTLLMFYLLVTNLWFQQWYAIWVLALVPLLKPGFASRLAQVFGFTVLSKQFIIGPAIFWQRPWPEQPWLEILFTLGTLGAAWLYAAYGLYERQRKVLEAQPEPAIQIAYSSTDKPIPFLNAERPLPFVSHVYQEVDDR